MIIQNGHLKIIIVLFGCITLFAWTLYILWLVSKKFYRLFKQAHSTGTQEICMRCTTHLKLQRSRNSSKLEKEWLHSAAIQSYIGHKKIIFSFGIAHWTPLNVRLSHSLQIVHIIHKGIPVQTYSLWCLPKQPFQHANKSSFLLGIIQHNPKKRAFLSVILELKQVINWSTTFFTHTTPIHNNFFW